MISRGPFQSLPFCDSGCKFPVFQLQWNMFCYVRCKWKATHQRFCWEAAERIQRYGPNTASDFQLVHEEGLLAHTEHVTGLGPKPAKLFQSTEDMSDFCNLIFMPEQGTIYLVSDMFWRIHKIFTICTRITVPPNQGPQKGTFSSGWGASPPTTTSCTCC